ncbi:hypothetical protein [Streptomyces formicae]|uniref:Phage protein n=1 Tax=Streptomyces formicae TaxID=1616117 RepID=A0ABY3WWU3_9ACTN|nr:hypothetical protein [Streptomyces formicae]UNM16031.1 hypothetical protein J4032_35270 [Streptomyces formicae]
MCDADDLEVGYLVDGARKYKGQRRFWRERFVICGDCYRAGFTPEGGQWPPGRQRDRIYWQDIVGRGEQMPPTPCANCGFQVIRSADPLLKRVTCSAACLTSLTRIRNGNQGSGQPCETCGDQITTGRADSRYCGSACRQKAYRQRKVNAKP